MTVRLSLAVAELRTNQESQADDLRALSNRLEALTRVVEDRSHNVQASFPGPRLLEP